MAAAATKISAVYKGNKDREMVKELKAAKESASAEAGKPDAPGEDAAWSIQLHKTSISFYIAYQYVIYIYSFSYNFQNIYI